MPATNAAIWFSSDAYDPTTRGINARFKSGRKTATLPLTQTTTTYKPRRSPVH